MELEEKEYLLLERKFFSRLKDATAAADYQYTKSKNTVRFYVKKVNYDVNKDKEEFQVLKKSEITFLKSESIVYKTKKSK